MKRENLTFGEAIEKIRGGSLVQRAGWNGKGMHIYLEEHFKVLLGKGGGLEHTRKYEPVIVMFTAQGSHQPGWLASQADILATDWQIVEA
jgi:hypothetical protein